MNEFTKQGVRNLNHLQPRKAHTHRKDQLNGMCGKDHQVESRTFKESWGDKIESFCKGCGSIFDTTFIDK